MFYGLGWLIFPPCSVGEIPAYPLVYVLDDTLIIADRNR
jgi:hypothetical protein